MKLSPVEHALGIRGQGQTPIKPLSRAEAKRLLAALDTQPIEQVKEQYSNTRP